MRSRVRYATYLFFFEASRKSSQGTPYLCKHLFNWFTNTLEWLIHENCHRKWNLISFHLTERFINKPYFPLRDWGLSLVNPRFSPSPVGCHSCDFQKLFIVLNSMNRGKQAQTSWQRIKTLLVKRQRTG